MKRTPGGSTGGTSVVIAKRSKESGEIRVGTLSWTGDLGASSYLSVTEFLAAVEVARPVISASVDLVLCAGRRVYENDRSLRPGDILERSGGAPVMFEWLAEDEDGSERCEWQIAFVDAGRPRLEVLRRDQLVQSSKDAKAAYRRLACAIAKGAGTVAIEGSNTRLVLLICGENNLLKHPGPGSACRVDHHSRAEVQRLATALAGAWVALNPAHNPYWPPGRATGAANVMEIGGASPLLGRVVAPHRSYKDGTRAPTALIHVNTFLRGTNGEPHRTEASAHVAFGQVRNDTPTHVERSGIIGWSYRESVVETA